MAAESAGSLLQPAKLRWNCHSWNLHRSKRVGRCEQLVLRQPRRAADLPTVATAWRSRAARLVSCQAAAEGYVELSIDDAVPSGRAPVEVEIITEGDAERHTSTADLLRFTVPTLGIWLIGPILSLVDTAFVGAQSTVELAAMAPGTMLCDYSLYVCTFLAIAVTNMLAVCFVKRDPKGVNEVLSDSLSIALVMGTLLGAALAASAPWMLERIAGPASAEVVAPALSYVRLRCLGFPAALIIFVTQSVFLAAQDPLTPLLATAAAGLINLGGDYIACNMLGLGIAGAAMATAAAQIVTALLLLLALRKPLRGSVAGGQRVTIDWRLPTFAAALVFVKFAGPICGIMASKVAMYSVLTSAASSIGPISAGAHHVCFSIWTFFAVYGDAVSQAAQTFLPASIGYPAAAWRFAKRMMLAGCLVGVMNSVASVLIATLAPTLFTRSPEVVATMARLAPMMAATLLVHNVSMATEGMLLAGRDLGFLLRSYVLNAVLVVAALRLIEATSGRSIMFVWVCILQFQVVRLLQNGARLVSRHSCLNADAALAAAPLKLNMESKAHRGAAGAAPSITIAKGL